MSNLSSNFCVRVPCHETDTITWQLAATLSIPRPEGPKPTDKTVCKNLYLQYHGALMEEDLLAV